MALILFLGLILLWIRFGKEIRKEQKLKHAIGVSIFVLLSDVFFWLIGINIIENQIAIFIADFLFGLYVIAIFVLGVFFYLHKRQTMRAQQESNSNNESK